MVSKQCYLCVAVLHLVFTYDDLSYKKVASQSSTWAGGSAYFATNAVDGNSLTCMRTLDIGTNSPLKYVWWKVDLGDIHNIHMINILFKNYNDQENQQRGRFAGFSLYVSKNDISSTYDIQSTTKCYRDGQELPPLNFTTTCTEYGRYVIFYNERLAGVKYPPEYQVENIITELCEVVVLGCNRTNVYGFGCDKQCPNNCKDKTCHIQEGTCFACESGWTGQHCNTKCKGGWYGQNCTQKCVGHCGDNSSCNHLTGLCDEGCNDGWTGNLCNDECPDGTYGYGCINNCSGHCLNNSPCNKQTGHCDRGCSLGYTDSDCKKECLSGHYGMDCRERCSGHCISKETCDHISGVCSNGCQDGYLGALCDDTCEEGYYGKNCSFLCALNCKACRSTDGLCSCEEGWTGLNCTEEILHDPQTTTWTVGFSISFAINIVLVCVICSSFWIICTRMFLSRNHTLCFKSNYYTDTGVKTDEATNYQELNLSQEEIAYQNIILQ